MEVGKVDDRWWRNVEVEAVLEIDIVCVTLTLPNTSPCRKVS